MQVDNSYNKILLCTCKKYKKGQKNGILLILYIDSENNIEIKPNNLFYNTKQFEVYCFCQIYEFDDFNKINVLNKKKNKMIATNYFLVGGFHIGKQQGIIKLYKINYDKDNFDKTNIEYIQDIEIEKNIREKLRYFKGFKGKITSIIQSRYNGNILLSCSDGNVYLLTLPNMFLKNVLE